MSAVMCVYSISLRLCFEKCQSSQSVDFPHYFVRTPEVQYLHMLSMGSFNSIHWDDNVFLVKMTKQIYYLHQKYFGKDDKKLRNLLYSLKICGLSYETDKTDITQNTNAN